ncbi:TPA: polysaccharide deacetylase family protein [bacterium]|nr:polysaccharide deacetylase family protein [bacterium]
MSCVIPILAYHKVDYRRELGITSISPKAFEKQINFLQDNGYSGLLPQSLFNLSENIDKKILITFDDGYECIYDHVYSILKRYNFPATIFLTTGYIGNYNLWDSSPGPRFRHLNWDQIREMSDNGICFGSHGVNHLFLTSCSDKTVRYELAESKDKLEKKLGKTIDFFSYPYGDYNSRITNIVNEIGYKGAFSLKPKPLKIAGINNQYYELPRFAIYYIDSMFDFRTKIGDVNNAVFLYTQQLKNRFINRCSYASMLIKTKIAE